MFLDAGFSINYHAILTSRLVGGSGKVIACEMMLKTARSLRKIILENRCFDVEVHERQLVSDEVKVVSVSFAAREPGSASIVRGDRNSSIEVATKKLEEHLEDFSSVAFV